MTLSNKTRLARFVGSLAVKRYLQPDRPLQPIVAELFLTQNCNLRCISCTCWHSRTEDELSRTEWMSAIDQLADLGFIKLNFTGGEPLLRPDALDLIRYAASISDAELHLNTNGILLTPSKAKALIEAGVLSYNISVDGPTPETHDGIRGRQGAFATTMEHLDALLELGRSHPLKVRMCCTVMNKTVDQLAAVARLAQQRGVQLFFNVVTDRTFLFRDDHIGELATMDMAALQAACQELQILSKRDPRFLPRPAVIAYLVAHFQDQLQQDLPCVESQLKLMIHSQGQVGGCWAEDPAFSLREASLSTIVGSDEFKRRQSPLYWKHCRGCGSNHALNMRLSPRHVLCDLLWQIGFYRPRTGQHA